jgi:uncharacterized repeat protein (TIGR03806 family)
MKRTYDLRRFFRHGRLYHWPFLALLTALAVGCNDDGLTAEANQLKFPELLSVNKMFEGDMSQLTPARGYEVYDLSTELFSDYAMKQRLIRVPHGTTVEQEGEGLPEFPDSTVLVKTFYYLNDERHPENGRRLLETRLLVKQEGRWNVATYVWNDSQSEALLVESGFNSMVNWIDGRGEFRVISYHVPTTRECVTCHRSGDTVTPIGPKAVNLNRSIRIGSRDVNQLDYLESQGILTRSGGPIRQLPSWTDTNESLEGRARAYLDVNCGHCHSSDGFASEAKVHLTFQETEGGNQIRRRKEALVEMMRRGRMPLIGTTLVHNEGLELITSYVKTLK